MKKQETAYTKFTKSRRGYNARQIAKGVGLGVALTGFGAAMKGAFNNIDLTNIGQFATQVGNKALAFYKELLAKCNPAASVPAYIFLGLAGGFIALMVHGRISKRKFETDTVSGLSVENQSLIEKNQELTENNEALQKSLTKSLKKAPAAPAAPAAPEAEPTVR